MNNYKKHGHETRADYLRHLAESFEVHLFTVEKLAEFLGPEEDFDGLITALQEINEEF